eukprot:2470830-Rhodomonas_salina.1
MNVSQSTEHDQMQQCTVVQCRIRGFSKVTGKVSLEAALDMIKQYVLVCAETINNCQGVLVDCSGVQIVSFWLAKNRNASFKELACHAVIKQRDEVQKLFATWQRYLVIILQALCAVVDDIVFKCKGLGLMRAIRVRG